MESSSGAQLGFDGLAVIQRQASTGALHPQGLGLRTVFFDRNRVCDGFLFRPVDRNGRVGAGALHPGDVSRIWKRMAEYGRVAPEIVRGISGHSSRVGFAQDMTAAGIDLIAIMQAGGWKSPNMVARYVEKLDVRQDASARLAAAQGRI